MTTTTDKALDALETRIMENAHNRWYVSCRIDGELVIHTAVANPGAEEYWLDIRCSPEKATVKMESNNYVEDAYELTVADLLQYLHQLPRPIYSFNAQNIFSDIAEGEK